MRRHLLLLLVRVVLGVGVVYALPLSHMLWGEPYPGDGQEGFGFMVLFTLIGFAAAVVYVVLGTLGQVLLRKRPARWTICTDLGLFLLLSGILVYGGVTARYEDSEPNKTLQQTNASLARLTASGPAPRRAGTEQLGVWPLRAVKPAASR